MPEGPSILHLRNQLKSFIGKTVKKAGGYGPMQTKWINGKKLLDIKTWGKHLLFIFSNGTVRVHLGLFGDVLVNERKKVNRSFYLEFAKGEINGYVVRAQRLTAPPAQVYDWRTDILSKDFDPLYVKSLLKDEGLKTIDDVFNRAKETLFPETDNVFFRLHDTRGRKFFVEDEQGKMLLRGRRNGEDVVWKRIKLLNE